MEIALTYRVTRKVVRLARDRAGAAKRPRGRPRGARRPRANYTPAAEQITARIFEEQRPGGPAATLSLLAQRVRALHEANSEGDRPAVKDALVSAAAACGLVLDHLQALEAA